MSRVVANPKNAALAAELRARADALVDPELKEKAERIALIVELSEKEAPHSVLEIALRKMTPSERMAGARLEHLASQSLARSDEVVA